MKNIIIALTLVSVAVSFGSLVSAWNLHRAVRALVRRHHDRA
jgi:hypothetical protein